MLMRYSEMQNADGSGHGVTPVTPDASINVRLPKAIHIARGRNRHAAFCEHSMKQGQTVFGIRNNGMSRDTVMNPEGLVSQGHHGMSSNFRTAILVFCRLAGFSRCPCARRREAGLQRIGIHRGRWRFLRQRSLGQSRRKIVPGMPQGRRRCGGQQIHPARSPPSAREPIKTGRSSAPRPRSVCPDARRTKEGDQSRLLLKVIGKN